MKISNRTHKGASITAAIIMLVGLVFGIVINAILMVVSYSLYEVAPAPATAVNWLSTVTTMLVVIVLFRGKKDALAAIFFLITAVVLVATGVVSGIVSIVAMGGLEGSGNDPVISSMIAGNWVAVLAALVGIGFRVLLAWECFKPGKISGCGAKALLIVVPIVYVLLSAVSGMVRRSYMIEDYGFAEFLLAAGLPAIMGVISSVSWIVLGIAFAKPVYEKDSFEAPCSVQTEESPC